MGTGFSCESCKKLKTPFTSDDRWIKNNFTLYKAFPSNKPSSATKWWWFHLVTDDGLYNRKVFYKVKIIHPL